MKHYIDSPLIHHWMGCGLNLSGVHPPSNGRWVVSRHGVPQKVIPLNISLQKIVHFAFIVAQFNMDKTGIRVKVRVKVRIELGLGLPLNVKEWKDKKIWNLCTGKLENTLWEMNL